MFLPYSRPRLIEIHEQPWCPSIIRQPVQTMLTAAWTTRFPIVQRLAPYEAVADTLQRVIDEIEQEDLEFSSKGGGGKRKRHIGIVDCCSGAGGPMPEIEKRINKNRMKKSLEPIKILLTDLHPHLSSWKSLSAASPTHSLSYLTYPVDATKAPEALTSQRHFRTFCLAFHHFGEEGARRVLEDAMRTSDGIGIFELQGPDLGSLFTVTLLFPLCWILTPFYRPNLTTLIFTYLIPIIPLILVLDGYVSAWRTRSLPHLLHLANLAAMSVSLEGGGGGRRSEKKTSEIADGDDVEGLVDEDGDLDEDDDEDEDVDWRWESGRVRHTWPGGYMSWVIGRRDRRGGSGDE